MPTPWMPPASGVSARTRAHALAHVLGRARIGEEHVLDARADGPHRQVGARLLLDLDHGRHVVEGVHRPPEVLEREEIVGRVLAHELDVVEDARVARPAPPPPATPSGCACPAWAVPPAAAPGVDCVACAESRGAGAPRQSPRYTRPVRDVPGPLSDRPLSDRPLSDLVVLDLTRVLAGPYCTRLLADLGARVRQDRAARARATTCGKDHLQLEPGRADQSTYFIRINVGKESVAARPRPPAGPRASCADLCRVADVVVENFAPGVVETLGLDYAALAAVKPDLVYCSISGFGQTGPWRERPAFAHIINAASGMMHLDQGDAAGAARANLQAADVLAGTHAFGAILAALLAARRAPGEGALPRRLDAGGADRGRRRLLRGGAERRRGAGLAAARPWACYAIGGRHLALQTGGAAALWPRLQALLGRPELAADPRFATPTARRAQLARAARHHRRVARALRHGGRGAGGAPRRRAFPRARCSTPRGGRRASASRRRAAPSPPCRIRPAARCASPRRRSTSTAGRSRRRGRRPIGSASTPARCSTGLARLQATARSTTLAAGRRRAGALRRRPTATRRDDRRRHGPDDRRRSTGALPLSRRRARGLRAARRAALRRDGGAARRAAHPLHHHAPRAGHELHGRRLRARGRRHRHGARGARARACSTPPSGLSTAYSASSPVLHALRPDPARAASARTSACSTRSTTSSTASRRSPSGASACSQVADIPAAVREAIVQLRTGRPRPVELEMPPETMEDEGEAELLPPAEVHARRRGRARRRPRRRDAARRAQRPLIYAGGGVHLSGAHDALAAVAEYLQAGVVAVRRGQGRGERPQRSLARRRLLARLAAARPRPRRGRGARGRHAPRPGDLQAGHAHRPDRRGRARRSGATTRTRSAWSATRGPRSRRSSSGCARRRPPRASRKAEREALRARIAADNTQEPNASILKALRAGDARGRDPRGGHDPDRLLLAAVLAGLRARGRISPRPTPAISATSIRWRSAPRSPGPDRPVVSVSGDGGFLYNAQELSTAARTASTWSRWSSTTAPTATWRAISTSPGAASTAPTLHNPDFMKLADAFGVHGMRAKEPTEVGRLVREAIDMDRPVLDRGAGGPDAAPDVLRPAADADQVPALARRPGGGWAAWRRRLRSSAAPRTGCGSWTRCGASLCSS